VEEDAGMSSTPTYRQHENGGAAATHLSADPAEVRRFLEAFIALAKTATNGMTNPGLLQIGQVHPLDEGYVPNRYNLDDVERMIADAIAFSDAGHNVYIEGRTVRAGLGTRRGAAEDTVAVFALVADDDGDMGKATSARPIPPTLLVESSPGNTHPWYFLARAVPPDEGVNLGKALRAKLGGDSDTGTITQPFRVGGTVNYPTQPKLERGRVVVLTKLLSMARAYTIEEFNAAFPPVPPEVRPEQPEGESDVDRSMVEFALSRIDPDIGRREWLSIGGALFKPPFKDDEGFAIWDKWSSKGRKYQPRKIKGDWRRLGKKDGYGWSIGTLLHYADEADPGWRRRYAEIVWAEVDEIAKRLYHNTADPDDWAAKFFEVIENQADVSVLVEPPPIVASAESTVEIEQPTVAAPPPPVDKATVEVEQPTAEPAAHKAGFMQPTAETTEPLPDKLQEMLQRKKANWPGPKLLSDFLEEARDQDVDESRVIKECLNELYSGYSIFEHVKESGGEEYIKKTIAAGHPTATSGDAVDLWSKFDPPELPTGLLPTAIEKYARIEGENMGCDPAGLAMAALAACAAAISDTIRLRVKEYDAHWTEPARLWVALVGDPSAKKSPILTQAAKPIGKIDRQLIAQYLEVKEDYDELSPDDKKDKKKNPPPKQPRIKIEDVTIEAAQEVLKDSPDGVLCLQDELSGFLGSIDKYAGNRGAGADRGFWMKAYNGGPSSFGRIGRGSGLIPNLSVNLLGGIQPDAIRKVAADGVDDGLLRRMLFIVLRPATVDQDKPRDPVVNNYAGLIDRLHMLQPPRDLGDIAVLRFDKGAQAIRSGLAKKHIELMGSEIVNKKLATHVGKYDGVFARLCVLWHCVENVDCWVTPTREVPVTVTEDTARRVAAFLHDFLFNHALAFYAGIVGLSDDHERLKNVAGFILAKKLAAVSNRDVQRGDRSMRKLTDFETVKIFEQLEAMGWLDRKPRKRGKGFQWVVNSDVHTQFAERAKRETERRAEARATVAKLFAK
jgi:Protein of unknown function (DUF3987)/Primase C terminal 2 (PriCT-2)/RepB DNA-primase from phage plasmid